MSLAINLTEAFRDLVQIGIALTSERDLSPLLNRIMAEARRFTRAEAGTLFLRENDELHFAVVQNDRLSRRLGEAEMQRLLQAEPLKVSDLSLAGHVAMMGEVVNIPDTYTISPDRPYNFNPLFDARCDYKTRSALVVPLQDPAGHIFGVLELINALDKTGCVVPFDIEYEALVRALASQAAVAIRNARLEDLSFKDALTDVYNRRYFVVRIEEESRRHLRFAEPVSLVLLDLDRFKDVNDRFGHRAGDEALREVARLLQKHSRNFTVVTRYGGDEFAVLLVNTPKAGAVAYAERILIEARRFTRAEAGTLFLREGDHLRFAVVQNDRLARELGEPEMKRLFQEQPLKLRELSLAGHVALTGDTLNLHDPYMIPPDRPYSFDARVDARMNYRTQSILVVPLQDPPANILGVLELINAMDRGQIVPFDSQFESLVRALASQAAVAIRNARLEDQSLKDALTDVYNRRYFMIRLEEEVKRHSRFGEPLSLVMLDVDHFKEINDRFGHRAGDETLRGIAELLLEHSRSFSVVTRYGGDEFAIVLVKTPKAGALTYADRMRGVVAQHEFRHGTVTVSLGAASLPEDGACGDDLVAAADKALYDAKRLGRNRVAAPLA